MGKPASFVRDCLVVPRHTGDVLFTVRPDRVEASLLGYAVVPIEYLEALERLVVRSGLLGGVDADPPPLPI